jgi:L-seryl-tRNA(Ser) seleniumtransferase
MNRLPDTTGMPNEIVLLRRHRNDYDHLLRLAGAKLVEVGFAEWPFGYEVEEAIGPNTAALFYLGHDPVPNLPLSEIVRIAHAHGLPVIVDASVALPPAANLHALIDQGADLVAFSGGKHILGPQASGILAGRRDLILSVALQHQDLDVYPETWPWRHLLAEGVLTGPPHHGIGRGFKVAKEEIAGLVVAVERYLHRDFAAEMAGWRRDLDTIARGLDGLRGIRATNVVERRAGQPMLEVEVDPDGRLTAAALVNGLQEREPIICTFEGWTPRGIVGFLPQSLLPGDADEIVTAVRSLVGQPAGVR